MIEAYEPAATLPDPLGVPDICDGRHYELTPC
jgi:hypothetical protein